MSTVPSVTTYSKEQELPLGRTRVSRPNLVVNFGSSRVHEVSTNLDKLEVSLHFRFLDRSVFDRFSELKSEVQQGMKPSIAVHFDEQSKVEKTFQWNLQRAGTRLHPYVLKSGDITLLLSSRSYDSPIPNAKIEIGSVSCQAGGFVLYRQLLEWLEVFGFEVHKEIVSRVDLAADFLGVSFSELPLDEKSRWISRGIDFLPHYKHWRLTGISHGSSRLLLRAYDKSLELKRNKTKEAFFYNLWGCKKGTPVTRVEYQLRRVVLKDFGLPVNTVKELQQNLDSLWQYLTHDWARFMDKPVDRDNKNHKQAPLSDFWKMVQDVVFRVSSQKNWRSIKKNLHKNLTALKDQARGCLLNFAAAAGHDVHDFDGIISTCVDVLSSDLSSFMRERFSDFKKLFLVRRNECRLCF